MPPCDRICKKPDRPLSRGIAWPLTLPPVKNFRPPGPRLDIYTSNRQRRPGRIGAGEKRRRQRL